MEIGVWAERVYRQSWWQELNSIKSFNRFDVKLHEDMFMMKSLSNTDRNRSLWLMALAADGWS